MLLEVLGPQVIAGWFALWLLVIGPLLVYPLARWKSHREQVVDPQLGIKVALSYFALIAFHVVLLALTFLLYALFAKMSPADKGATYRTGFALLLPAVAVFATHFVLLRRTSYDELPIVKRLVLGYNAIITGLLGFTALLLAFQLLFKKGSTDNYGKLAIAAMLVYMSAWVATAFQFFRQVFLDGAASASAAPQVASPASAVTQPTGPVLPPLSAGSFPPIDQK
jgi:hypothetical protein